MKFSIRDHNIEVESLAVDVDIDIEDIVSEAKVSEVMSALCDNGNADEAFEHLCEYDNGELSEQIAKKVTSRDWHDAFTAQHWRDMLNACLLATAERLCDVGDQKPMTPEQLEAIRLGSFALSVLSTEYTRSANKIVFGAPDTFRSPTLRITHQAMRDSAIEAQRAAETLMAITEAKKE